MKHRFNSSFIISIIFIFLATTLHAQNTDRDIQQTIQLVEYIGVDYSSAVVNTIVIDEGEFEEMLEFSELIVEKVQDLSSIVDPNIIQLSLKLQQYVKDKKSHTEIKKLSSELKSNLAKLTSEINLPQRLLDTNEVNIIYKNECSSCHGERGLGDGVNASFLSPKPTNFQDVSRANDRSLLGLYQVITKGLEGTSMGSFERLSFEQRWSLAFKVGGFAYKKDDNSSININLSKNKLSIQDFVMYSPNELKKDQLLSVDVISNIRTDSRPYYFSQQSALELTKYKIKQAQIEYSNNNQGKAKTLIVSAYLDGFELVENSLDAHDNSLRKQIESKLMILRQEFSKNNNEELIAKNIKETLQLIDFAENLLTNVSLSNTTLFTASFIILLREGLEALLVVLALLTILIRSNHTRGRKYLHIGWSLALVAGVFTWIAAEYLIEISGASREIMEGVAAMLAAIILLFVGFWMHNKSKAGQWQSYIKNTINNKLKTGSLWGIAGLAFITVYREVFETVLFYQSLILQIDKSQLFILLSGFVFGAFILVLIAWLVIKYSVKIPISKFFSSTSYIILILAFILAGKAIAALQEAAIIPATVFPMNLSFEWFGIYPTWQGLIVQLFVLIISSLMLYKQKS